MSHAPEPTWPELQDLFARGAPVIAIGPGCHRIGYHETEEWKRVISRFGQVWHRLGELDSEPRSEDFREQAEKQAEARQGFLERFWAVRLRNVTGGELSIRDLPPGEDADAVRIVLGTYLLRGLIEATRLLGATVAAGAEPVMDWQHLIATVECEEKEEDRREMLSQARKWIQRAARLSATVGKALDAKPLGEELEEHPLTKGDVEDGNFQLLKVMEISSALDLLLKTRLRDDIPDVSGAVVEWLSDLFWHVMVSGAGVPPSQGELSFYLNLHVLSDDSPTERFFSRVHPGEYRGSSPKGISKELETLVTNYDRSLKKEEDRDWTRPREAFAWRMALTLVESWRREKSEKSKRVAVALISDYDLMLERAVFELLEEGEEFHVVTPAVVNGSNGPGYEWLMGTFAWDAEGAGGLEEPAWEWFDQRLKSNQQATGPVLIRLTGTPLFKMSKTDRERLVEAKNFRLSEPEPVAVFSEHDSAQAIMALTPSRKRGGQQPPERLQRELLVEGGLSWSGRGWVFLGHRFSDWLPRLQLLITTLMLAQGERREDDSDTPRRKVAISRRFDWPERALLDALEIATKSEELENVTTYFKAKPADPHLPKTAEFVRAMEEAPCGPPTGEHAELAGSRKGGAAGGEGEE